MSIPLYLTSQLSQQYQGTFVVYIDPQEFTKLAEFCFDSDHTSKMYSMYRAELPDHVWHNYKDNISSIMLCAAVHNFSS